MPFPDIKDAGILAGFTRWGWPWHGVIRGGAIDGSGKAHTQPSNNDAWLIDMGMPPISLTVDEQAFATANNMEWRNYALIPGGRVYDTYLGDRTFIHVDSDNVCWKVALSFGFTGNTLNISASIVRFGLFQQAGVALPTPVIKTVDVACTEIALSNPVSLQNGAPYGSRVGRLEDVWTNGRKALIGVVLIDSGATVNELFSVVTLDIGGSGGADGSGLTLAAVESIAQPDLTTLVANTGYTDTTQAVYANEWSSVNDKAAACAIGATFTETWTTWESTNPDFIIKVSGGSANTKTWARYAYFKHDGEPAAARLRIAIETSETVVSSSRGTLLNPTVVSDCGNNSLLSGGPIEVTITANTLYVKEEGYWLLENDTIVDKLVWRTEYAMTYSYVARPIAGGPWSTDSSSGGITPAGSLASFFPASYSTFLNQATLTAAFRSAASTVYSVDVQLESTSIFFGIHRIATKATAFVATNGSTSAYGTAMTPLGPLAVGLTPASTTNFAWQRKTGEHEFDSEPICWV